MSGIVKWSVAKFTDLYMYAQPYLLSVVERHVIPDAVIRFFVRREIEKSHARVESLSTEQRQVETMSFIEEIKTLPIAVQQNMANEQHYEVPDAFYQLVLGPHLKYSSGYWPSAETTLEQSEAAMLEMYCERAQLEDGMSLIDLGCGWGSVSLYMAKKYPKSRITSISNSKSQKKFIMAQAEKRGLRNVQVLTGDINSFDLPAEMHGTAHRIISIEMFEHMKNYQVGHARALFLFCIACPFSNPLPTPPTFCATSRCSCSWPRSAAG